MYMIFSFSGQEGDVSSSLSFDVSCRIIRAADYIFDAGLEEWQITSYAEKIDFITRKLAHVTEYFLLAIAVSFPLYVYGMHGLLLMLCAGLFCVGFACTDEFHQSMVSGRLATPKDVCIDSIGIFIGILIVRMIGWTGRHTIFAPARNDDRFRGRYEEDEYERGYEQRRTRREMRALRKRQDALERDLRRSEQGRSRTDGPEEDEPYDRYEHGSRRDRYEEAGRRDRYDGYPEEEEDMDGYETFDPDEDSSDELSDDMPFSGLFRRRSRRR